MASETTHPVLEYLEALRERAQWATRARSASANLLSAGSWLHEQHSRILFHRDRGPWEPLKQEWVGNSEAVNLLAHLEAANRHARELWGRLAEEQKVGVEAP